MLVRASWRRRGCGLHMLEDFCSSFSTEEFMGVSSPLSPSMVAGQQRFSLTLPTKSIYLFIYIHSLPSLFPFILIWRIILLDDGQNNAHCWLVHWLSVLYKYATWEQQKDLVGNVRALMYLGQTPKCHNTPKINQLHFNLSSHNYPQSPQRPQEEQRIWTLRYTVFGVKEAA